MIDLRACITKKGWQKLTAVLVILICWQILAMIIGQEILLVSPVQVLKRLGTIWKEPGFFSAIVFTGSRICGGFLQGLLVAVFMALLAAKWPVWEILFWPWSAAIKAVPVASFVVVCLVWLSGRKLPILVAFLIVVPVVYQNVLQGLKKRDEQMDEVCKIYQLDGFCKFRYITLPILEPFILSAASISAGMAWKAGVAAEIIGTPNGSIGKAMYQAKIYLDTDDLLAWTVLIVLMSIGFEKCFLYLLKRGLKALSCGGLQIESVIEETLDGQHLSEKIETGQNRPADTNCENDVNRKSATSCETAAKHVADAYNLPVTQAENARSCVRITNLCKKYQDNLVLENVSFALDERERLGIMGASGIGKTTLLRILAGLETADAGSVLINTQNISVCFQENRLCEQLTAVQNLVLFTRHEKSVEVLRQLGFSKEDLQKNVSEFSGGMKRRVALARCLMKDADLYLMDEAFKELDEKTKQQVLRVCNTYLTGKTCIIVSHDAEDIRALGGKEMYLK